MTKYRGLLLTAAFCLAWTILFSAATLNTQQTLPTSGVIAGKGLAVYLDPDGTEVATNIEWGTINPGTAAQRTVYVKNTGTVAINLNITTNTVAPINLFSMVTFASDKQGAQIQPDETIPMILNLTALTTADPTNFSFNILIAATE